FFLPEQMTINGSVEPEIRRRGIFDAVVYESDMQIKSLFNRPDFKSLSIPEEEVLWSGAYISFGVTDLRGISANPQFVNGDGSITAEPSNDIGVAIRTKKDDTNENVNQHADHISRSGVVAKLNWEGADSFKSNVDITLKLKGSKRLHFVPVGKTTSVTLKSPWKDPSFDGEF